MLLDPLFAALAGGVSLALVLGAVASVVLYSDVRGLLLSRSLCVRHCVCPPLTPVFPNCRRGHNFRRAVINSLRRWAVAPLRGRGDD